MIMDNFDDGNILFHLNWVSKSPPAGQNPTCTHIFAENDKKSVECWRKKLGCCTLYIFKMNMMVMHKHTFARNKAHNAETTVATSLGRNC